MTDFKDKTKSLSDTSKLSRETLLYVDRGRWFLISLILLVALIFTVMSYISLSKSSKSNYKVAYIKMYSNGTWDVNFEENYDTQHFVPIIVDNLLTEWAEKRFSENPLSVRSDWGIANLFHSPKLANHFLANEENGGFNAPSKAVKIQECQSNCVEISYKIKLIDHFDANNATFNNENGIIYRSNLFSLATYSRNGLVFNTEKRIIRVDWHLLTHQQINKLANKKDGRDWLKTNPIGLEIIKHENLLDPSN